MKTDPINIAIVLLVFANALAVVQFQALARTSPLETSKVATIEVPRQHMLVAVRD